MSPKGHRAGFCYLVSNESVKKLGKKIERRRNVVLTKMLGIFIILLLLYHISLNMSILFMKMCEKNGGLLYR